MSARDLAKIGINKMTTKEIINTDYIWFTTDHNGRMPYRLSTRHYYTQAEKKKLISNGSELVFLHVTNLQLDEINRLMLE